MEKKKKKSKVKAEIYKKKGCLGKGAGGKAYLVE